MWRVKAKPLKRNLTTASVYHQWQQSSSFPLMPKVSLFLSFFASLGPVNSQTTAVNSFFVSSELANFFGHAPSFFARLSVFSSFLEKKYCTLWRYILRPSVCCWVSFIVCLRSDSARRPLKNIQHRIFKQKFLIQESTCQIWIGNLKNN